MRWQLPWSRKAEGGTIRSASELLKALGLGNITNSGAAVTLETALRVSTVLACARVIADGLAQVPLKLYRDTDGRKTPARDHPLWDKLHSRPSEVQTSFEFRETMALHLVLAGRFVAFKNVVRGRVEELLPLDPNGVTVKAPARLGERPTYHVQFDGRMQELSADQVWHVKGPSWNGWDGMHAIRQAREAIGLAIASEQSQARLHANGLRTSGTYSVEGKLQTKDYTDLLAFLRQHWGGSDKHALPMIVDRSAKWLPHTMTGVDAQAIETRRYQVEEICRALRVMPIMVGYSDKAATYASAEQMFLAHVVHTLAPWVARIEQSIDAHLLTEEDRRAGYYSHFTLDGLQRGAMKDRGDYLAKALGSGGSPAWMTQDEVRALEELNPMGGTAAVLPVATNVPKSPVDPAPAGA